MGTVYRELHTGLHLGTSGRTDTEYEVSEIIKTPWTMTWIYGT